MGTFDYPFIANDVKFILTIPDQLKDAIFQVMYFRTSYFNNPWILPFPSTSMKGIGNPRMSIPLSATEVA
jgi:hypothetical protein